MIEVRELTKTYGPHHAIERLSFTVKKGEVVGFLGPNGAGKTTTMKIITGFMAPTEGSVKVAGFDVFENPIEVKRRIGYLPETPPVYGEMTVESYLRFVARLKGVEKGRLSQMVERAIEKTDLGNVRKRLIQNLSKGYRQRVGISQALVSDPELPFSTNRRSVSIRVRSPRSASSSRNSPVSTRSCFRPTSFRKCRRLASGSSSSTRARSWPRIRSTVSRNA